MTGVVRHRLPLLLVLCVLAVTAGAKTFLEMRRVFVDGHSVGLPRTGRRARR